MKVLLNSDYGGFSVSEDAGRWMAERGSEWAKRLLKKVDERKTEPDGLKYTWYGFDCDRDDPLLIACFEENGSEFTSGTMAALRLADVPDEFKGKIKSMISDYDGIETIHEPHRSW